MVLRILLLVLSCACIPKSGGGSTDANNASVTMATVDYSPDDSAPDVLPSTVQSALEAELKARGLSSSSPLGQEYRDTLGQFQVVQRQLTRLAEDSEDTDLIVLLHTRVEFFSLMVGRYRWTVQATLAVADPDDPSTHLERTVEIPVFLPFHHQQEAEALEAATPALARELGYLLDSWLRTPAQSN
jgi:hypothetical protein